MTGLFRSKSCGIVRFTFNPPTPDFHSEENENEEEEDDEDAEEEVEEFSDGSTNPITTPYFSPSSEEQGGHGSNSNNHFTILDMVVAALRKSLVTCSVESEDVSAMDISWPTEVRHVSHVTFDRFNGFLGLPSEFEPELPRKVPSASANVFGVSAKSMQCSYDDRGNSVPSILLMMQKRLYVEGGLKAEGIFRINAENSHEVYVRHELNKGVVPRGIDVHCLAGLIKAWFRELPSGVLDSLTPEQVLHCNTEDDCTQLVKLLPPTEAALLDWAVNLMADVVEHEQYNKMNARNVAMVFAPNMTQMADPLTALIHAVQVMNLLKTLILKTLREREESASKSRLRSSCLRDSPTRKTEPCQSNLSEPHVKSQESRTPEVATTGKYLSSATVNVLESDNLLEEDRKLQKISDGEEELGSIPGSSPPSFEKTASESKCKVGGYDDDDGEWLSLRKGVRRLCRHPVFQMSKPAKKTQGLGIVNARGGREAWA